MGRPRSRLPLAGEDFPMTVPLDGEVAAQVLDLAQQQGVPAARVLRELVSKGLERSGAQLNHRVLQRREALREVKQQVLGEVRGAVADAFSRMGGRPRTGGPARRPPQR